MRWVQLPTLLERRALIVAAETGILLASFAGAMVLRLGPDAHEVESMSFLLPKAALAVAVFQVCLYYANLYDDYTTPFRAELLVRLSTAFLGGTVLLALVFYTTPALRFGRGIIALYLPFGLLGVYLWRLGCLRLWGHEALRETVLILGTGPSAQELAREALGKAPLDYHIAGFVGERPGDVGRRLVNPSVIGVLEDLPALLVREKVNLIVVALDDLRGKLPVAELLRARMAGVRVVDAATFFERVTRKILLRDLRPSWFVFSEGFHKPRVFGRIKRLVEATVAALILLVVSPLMLVIAALVRLESRGPVLYRQDRVGERGRLFKLYKFRTMAVDAETETGPVWTRRGGDPRVTRMGGLLRKLRLDELPQFWNVLRGEMSLVGPRPERPHFVEKLRTVIPYYDERHTVKPGITGWAQIKFGYGSNLEDAEEKLQYDLYYVKHMSGLFDFQIVLHTLKVMALGRGR